MSHVRTLLIGMAILIIVVFGAWRFYQSRSPLQSLSPEWISRTRELDRLPSKMSTGFLDQLNVRINGQDLLAVNRPVECQRSIQPTELIMKVKKNGSAELCDHAVLVLHTGDEPWVLNQATGGWHMLFPGLGRLNLSDTEDNVEYEARVYLHLLDTTVIDPVLHGHPYRYVWVGRGQVRLKGRDAR